MDERDKALSPNMQYTAADADKLLACADGTCALLYLHILRRGSFSLSAASRELRRCESDIALAAETLRKLDILREDYGLEEQELPEYSAKEIAIKAEKDSNFEGIVVEAQRRLGKILSTNDLKILLGIYDHLGLPAEVIMLLIVHCAEVYEKNHGEGRVPPLRHIEKEAWHWARTEVLTFDMAEEHIRLEKEKDEDIAKVKEALQIKGRAITSTEEKYINSWLELGFTADSIALAYDRTIIGTGKLAWKYLDKILATWHEKNLHTPEEIGEGDRRAPKTTKSADGTDEQKMRLMYERMKDGR